MVRKLLWALMFFIVVMPVMGFLNNADENFLYIINQDKCYNCTINQTIYNITNTTVYNVTNITVYNVTNNTYYPSLNMSFNVSNGSINEQVFNGSTIHFFGGYGMSVSQSGLNFTFNWTAKYLIDLVNQSLQIQIGRIDALNLSKLDKTDQRYNETGLIDALNLSKASVGSVQCPTGYYLWNVTLTPSSVTSICRIDSNSSADIVILYQMIDGVNQTIITNILSWRENATHNGINFTYRNGSITTIFLFDNSTSGSSGSVSPTQFFIEQQLHFASSLGTNQQWTNMALAFQEFLNVDRDRIYYNLSGTGLSQSAFYLTQAVAGTANSRIWTQCSPNVGITWYNTSSTNQYLVGNAIGIRNTNFDAIHASCIDNNVIFRIVGKGGDGATDPSFRMMYLRLRGEIDLNATITQYLINGSGATWAIDNETIINQSGHLEVNGTWINESIDALTYWTRAGTLLTQKNIGDDINTSGNIYPATNDNLTIGLGGTPSTVVSSSSAFTYRFGGVHALYFTPNTLNETHNIISPFFSKRDVKDTTGVYSVIQPTFYSETHYNLTSLAPLGIVYSENPIDREGLYIFNGAMVNAILMNKEILVNVKINETNRATTNLAQHYFLQFNRDLETTAKQSGSMREEFSVWSGGAIRNRYRFYNLITLGAGLAPDTVVVNFPYTLPDTNYVATAICPYMTYVEMPLFKQYFYVYTDASERFITKTTTGVTLYLKYTAFNAITGGWYYEYPNQMLMNGALAPYTPALDDTLHCDVFIDRYL